MTENIFHTRGRTGSNSAGKGNAGGEKSEECHTHRQWTPLSRLVNGKSPESAAPESACVHGAWHALQCPLYRKATGPPERH